MQMTYSIELQLGKSIGVLIVQLDEYREVWLMLLYTLGNLVDS